MNPLIHTLSNISNVFEKKSLSLESALEGWVKINSGLVLLKGHYIVLRRDYRSLNQVRLLSGGWSGYEPIHTGFVGPGMLTAAVIGEKFCQPSYPSILIAIKELAIGNPHGVLLILMNHPSQKINFTLAVEKAKREGITVEVVFVKDDCSGKLMKDERKGLAGVSLIMKVAGAMADQKRPLEEIAYFCSELGSLDIATISANVLGNVVVHSDVIPDNVDSINNDYEQVSYETLKRAVKVTSETLVPDGNTFVHPFTNLSEMVKTLLGYIIEGTLSKYSVFKEGEAPLALLINNYGLMSFAEANVLVRELNKELQKRNITVERVYSGSVITSRTGGLYSITAMKVNEEMLCLLDHPVTAPGWPTHVMFKGCPETPLPKFIEGQWQYVDEEPKELGPILSETYSNTIHRVLEFITMALLSCEYQMNKVGADFNMSTYGTQIRIFAEAMTQNLYENKLKLHCPYALLMQLSTICSHHLQNATGSLYAVFFDGGAQAFLPYFNETPMVDSMWVDSLEYGIHAIEYFGGLKRGERTMLDALYPMLETMRNSPESPVQIAEAAELGSMNTINVNLITQNIPDPGSHTVAIWARAAVEGLTSDEILAYSFSSSSVLSDISL